MKSWVKRIAIKTAAESKYGKYLHGAVIESGGAILSTGVNSKKIKHPTHNIFSSHSEVVAINAFLKKKKKKRENIINATLYSCRVTKSRIANARPCFRCLLSIKAAGIREVVYSIDDTTWGVMNIV